MFFHLIFLGYKLFEVLTKTRLFRLNILTTCYKKKLLNSIVFTLKTIGKN